MEPSIKETEFGPQRAALQATAAFSSYVVLSGIWFVLALTFAVLALGSHRPGVQAGVAISLAVGLLWVCWLRGFRLQIGIKNLEYRDGLYRSVVVPVCEIKEVKNSWVEWRVLSRLLRVPRLIVVYGNPTQYLFINTKPFSRQKIHRAIELLRGSNLK